MLHDSFFADRRETAERVFQLATGQDGNDFAPNYYEHPEALTQLLKGISRLERAVKEFQQRQWDGIEERLNLAATGSLKFDQWEDLGIFIDFYWREDEEILAALFAEHLPSSLTAGAVMSMSELGQWIDYSPADLPALRFLEIHTPRLARDINEVTKQRVKNSIRRSLLAGHSRDEMVEAMKPIITNKARREAIAQTESVQAFSEGRIQAGIEMGAIDKRWRAQVERCPICAGLHGQTVPITGQFPGGYYSAPAHTRCRCGIELSFGSKQDTANVEQYRSAYINGLRSRL